MVQIRSRNLQTRLFLLMLLAFFPAVALYWYANRELRSLQIEAHEQHLVYNAQVTAVEYEHLLNESKALLGSLATFPEIRNPREPVCHERLYSVLESTPHYTTITIIGLDGYMVCGALTVDGGLYLGDRAYFRVATTLNRFTVGEYALGRITGKAGVGVALPITEDGKVTAVLAASIDLMALARNTARIRLREETTFTVVDRSGTVLVRLPDRYDENDSDRVGTSVSEGFPGLPDGIEAVIVEGTDLDGTERVFAVAPLRGGGSDTQGYVVVGQARDALIAQVDDVIGNELRFLALAGAVLLVAAWMFGHIAIVKGAED